METQEVAPSRIIVRDEAMLWNCRSLFFGGIAMVLISIGFVSPRSGQDLVLNMRYWDSPWFIIWATCMMASAVATGVCQFMRWQLLHPKPGVEPWDLGQVLFVGAVLVVVFIIMICGNVFLWGFSS